MAGAKKPSGVGAGGDGVAASMSSGADSVDGGGAASRFSTVDAVEEGWAGSLSSGADAADGGGRRSLFFLTMLAAFAIADTFLSESAVSLLLTLEVANGDMFSF